MSRRRPSRPVVVPDQPGSLTDGENRANNIPAIVTPAGDQPCPGPCNTQFRRAEETAHLEVDRAHTHHEAHGDDQPCDRGCVPDQAITGHDTPFHPGKPTWCVDVHAFNDKGEMLDRLDHRGCGPLVIAKLRDLPDLATWLTPGKLNTPRDTEIDSTSSKSGGAKAMAHAPSPSPGWDTADELIRWAVDLEDWLREVIRDEPNRSTYRALSTAVAYLAAHESQLLASSDAERIGHDILRTHRRLERLVGSGKLTHRIVEPCPLCKRKSLRRKDGDELVRCRSCPGVWAWDQFQFLARTYADSVKGKGATG